MSKLIEFLKNEPVMLLVVLIAVVLTVLVQAGVVTVDQINGAVDTFWTVLGIVVVAAGALVARSKVTPTRKG